MAPGDRSASDQPPPPPPPGPPPPPPPPGPPPPGEAQRLVAKAGFTVYEDGASMLSHPVLVFLSSRAGRYPLFQVFDHVDRPLGSTRRIGHHGLLAASAPVGLHDASGSPLIEVRPQSKIFRLAFSVSGVANGTFTMPSIGSRELTIEANREPFGSVRGSGFRGLGGSHLAVFDHDENQVAAIRVFIERRSLIQRSIGHVISVDPGLGGELRRLLVAAPIIIESIRRSQEVATT